MWELHGPLAVKGYQWKALKGDANSFAEQLSNLFHISRFVLYDAHGIPVAYYSSSLRFGVVGKLICTSHVDDVVGVVILSLIVGPIMCACRPRTLAQVRSLSLERQARVDHARRTGESLPCANMWQQPALI